MFRRVGLALALLLTLPAASHAALITVGSGTDTSADDGVCTLREAVRAVNAQAATGGCPAGDGNADTIRITVPTVTLTQAGDREDNNATGDLDLRAPVTIEGGATIDAAGIDRVLDVAANVQATVRDVTLTGGKAPGGNNGFGYTMPLYVYGNPGLAGEDGGGVRNAGLLTLTRVVVKGNATSAGGNGASVTAGGVLTVTGGSAGRGGRGGGVASTGPLTIEASSVTDNTTGPGGKGGDATNTTQLPTGSGSISGTGGQGGDGGGVAATGATTIRGTLIARNTTGHGGDAGNAYGSNGANSSSGDGGDGGTGTSQAGGAGGFGGGVALVDNAVLGLTGSLVLSNATGGGGGGGLGFGARGGNSTATSGSHPGGAAGTGRGGRGGTGGAGGGVALTAGSGTVNVTSTTVALNATGAGGPGGLAVATQGGNSQTAAGGAGGRGTGGAGGAGGAGGGASNGRLSAVTLSGNGTGAGAAGGNAQSGEGGAGTPSGASPLPEPGAAGATGTPRVVSQGSLRGSILAEPVTGACMGLDLAGSLGNLVTTGSDCPGTVGDAGLGALTDNGGPTQTYALPAGSPALDLAGTAACPATDQRGVARPFGTGCDAGAYERAAPVVATGAASVTGADAALAATVNPSARATTAHFVFGSTTSYGSASADVPVAAGVADVPVTVTISGLAAGVTYHYAIVASNADGTASGTDATFTTAGGAAVSPTPSPTPVPPPTTSKPVLTKLKLRPARFRTKASKPGTRITYTDSASVRTTFRVQRRAKRRFVKVKGTFAHRDTRGRNSVRWKGRLKGRRLRPGRYRLLATPAGGATVRRAFRVRR